MIIPKGLIQIAQQLKEPLYIVGGFVRNHLLWGKSPNTDIDICSALTPQEVVARLVNNITVVPINPKIGTLKLVIEEEEYEYTCFRRDNYPQNGRHTPEDVVFIKDIREDALRRDFTVNAVYYDIMKGQIVDPLGKGVEDISKKEINTTTAPEKVFGEDGLRLMRLVRFSAELGFSIGEETKNAAKQYAKNLSDIAPERKTAEFNRLLVADKKYDIKDAHYKGLVTIGELGLWRYLIPQLEDCIGILQREDKHKHDVYFHSLEAVRVSPPEIRLAMLLHDIGKPVSLKLNNNMHKHPSIGAEMTKEILSNQLRYPKSVMQKTARLVKNHMYDFDGNTGVGKLRVFIQKNHDIIDELLKVKEADGRASGYPYDNSIVERMRNTYFDMIENNVPLTLKDLDINGIDVLELGAINVELSTLLNAVLEESAKQGRKLSKEEQLDCALRLLNKH